MKKYTLKRFETVDGVNLTFVDISFPSLQIGGNGFDLNSNIYKMSEFEYNVFKYMEKSNLTKHIEYMSNAPEEYTIETI